jgi:hypothetical protein
MTAIGLGGFAGSGKNLAAKALLGTPFHYSERAFARPLKATALRANPYIEGGLRLKDHYAKCNQDWDVAKQHPEVRRFLQELGVGMRECIDTDVFVNVMWRSIEHSNVVFTDVRFENEARFIREFLHGVLVLIKRPGVSPAGGHQSETRILQMGWDYTIDNDGSKKDLEENIRAIARMVQVNERNAYPGTQVHH